jgi:hypothetical protein
MAEVTDLNVGVLSAAARAAAGERRRSGRSDTVSQALLPLLRDPTRGQTEETLGRAQPVGEAHPESDFTSPSRPDDLAPLRGIIAAVVISVPLWMIVAGGIYWLF